MQRVLTLYRSSVGKKVAMALSGIVLTGFLLLHMVGNLKSFSGQQGFDAYAAFLREVGSPAVPHEGLLWTFRVVLLLAVVVHVVAAFQTWSQSRAAHDEEGFGSCTNHGACQVVCPKGISVDYIALLNRDLLGVTLRSAGQSEARESEAG